MKEVVAFFARNLEADEAELFSGHHGLLAFAAVHRRSKRHKSPPKLGWLFLAGHFVSERFQVLVSFMQARSNRVDRVADRQVVHSDIYFGFVFFQKSPDDQRARKYRAHNAHGDFLRLRAGFWPHGSGSFRLPSRDFPAGATVSSKRFPMNSRSSSPERNRSSVQESTSSTQPSKHPLQGCDSGPN